MHSDLLTLHALFLVLRTHYYDCFNVFSSFFEASKQSGQHFGINHFSGPVVYDMPLLRDD